MTDPIKCVTIEPTKVSVDELFNLDNEFYIIEFSNKISNQKTNAAYDKTDINNKVINSIYNAPKSVLDEISLLTEFTLITPKQKGDIFVSESDKKNVNVELYLYSFKLNALVRIDSIKDDSTLYDIFNDSYLYPEETILHFGRIIPSYSVSGGHEKPSVLSYFINSQVYHYTLAEETFGVKNSIKRLKEIKAGKYRPIFSISSYKKQIISLFKKVFKK
jgi:hypothetical protein